MSYKLQKPYTEKQRLDFIVEYNHNQGLEIKETDTAIYALEAWEKFINGEVVADLESYKAKEFEYAHTKKVAELKSELAALDVKRIRAMCEPSDYDGAFEVQDVLREVSAKPCTWLEYYNLQAKSLREELQQLENKGEIINEHDIDEQTI